MSDLIERARVAVKDARILLEAGSPQGAISRAYYSMFHAARAALRAIDPELNRAKTHATVLRRFSRHVIVEQRQAAELGRQLRTAFELRQFADYDGPDVSMAQARIAVENAETFLDELIVFIGTRSE